MTDIASEIYQKYYLQAKKVGLITNLRDYSRKEMNLECVGCYNCDCEDQIDEYINDHRDRFQEIDRILGLETVIWILRNLNGKWDDTLRVIESILTDHKNKYQEKWRDLPDTNDWRTL